jgi:hypothetical protein
MSTTLIHLVAGAAINLVFAVLIVRFIYYLKTQDKNYVFSFLAFNTVIYFVLGLLASVELSLGVGFGLFAIFSVLRYRTTEMPIREMTYLFTAIALPVMNSVLLPSGEYVSVLIANTIVAVVLWVLEREWGFHFEQSKVVTYDRVDLVTPANRALLLADLRERTGLPVERVEVGAVDFLRDTAVLTIYYDEPKEAQSVKHKAQSAKHQQNADVPISVGALRR